MTYKEYAKKKYEDALSKKHFDPDGNSTTAVCNRGFFKQVAFTVPDVNYGFIDLAKETTPALFIALARLVFLILAPISYPLILLISTRYVRTRAKKDMMRSYVKDKADQLHK